MPAKSLNKKSTRQKRLIHSIAVNKGESEGLTYDLSTLEGREAAIARQFNQIQKDYSKLIVDVAREFDLVKGWIGTQASTKRDEIKTMLSTRLSGN